MLLLSLSLIGIYKPAKADPVAATMFAIPFVGAIIGQAMRNNNYDHEEWTKDFTHTIQNLNHIPTGGCKIFTKIDDQGVRTNGRACKQADGSWRMD